MKNNTVVANNGVEIYTNNMFYYVNEYISTLRNPDDIYTSNVFTGLIKYIKRNVKFDKDIYENIDILNNIWEVYTELVYKYMQKPTIEEFSILIGIHRDTIYSWMNGETRKDDYSVELGTSRSDTIKKWQDECRLGRYKSAASGNVGGIFLCKAVDGMTDNAPVQVVIQEQHRTAEQIAADYGAAAALPGDVTPDF